MAWGWQGGLLWGPRVVSAGDMPANNVWAGEEGNALGDAQGFLRGLRLRFPELLVRHGKGAPSMSWETLGLVLQHASTKP